MSAGSESESSETSPAEELDQQDPDFGDVYGSAKGVLTNSWGVLTVWVQRRTRLSQILLASGISLVASETLPSIGAVFRFVTQFTSLSDGQLIFALIAVVLGQTIIQTQKLNQLQSEVATMRESPAMTDGGDSSEGRGTSGGGAIGGAIAGGALGSSYGPGGTVAGILFGAILGDKFEESTMTNDDLPPRDDDGRFKERE